jgi:hypothetical protein
MKERKIDTVRPSKKLTKMVKTDTGFFLNFCASVIETKQRKRHGQRVILPTRGKRKIKTMTTPTAKSKTRDNYKKKQR